MEIRNVRLEGGFEKGGSVQVSCGVCKIKRRKPGRLYIRWMFDSGKYAIGTVCMDCFVAEVEKRYDTYLPVARVRKAKIGICSCGADAKGGVKLILQHSLLEQQEKFMCKGCAKMLTGVEG